MKKSLKVALTILLIVTVIVSIVGAISAIIMFSNNYDDFYTKFSVLSNGVLESQRADAIVSTLFSFTNVGIIATFAVLFIFISIGCIVGIVYIYVGDSDTRIKELETIVDEAHKNIKHDEHDYEEGYVTESINIQAEQ